MNPIELSLFSSRIAAVCDEMGALLRRTAFSPNIKDRLDFSCAVFDAAGHLCAQAAHIPVHLGSMAYAMADIVSQVEWLPGDQLVVNDPYLGGTHLPDVTVIAPVFVDTQLMGFVANRAHHANIGASSPGSMPISSRLEEEGVVIPPTHIQRDGQLIESVMSKLVGDSDNRQARGDFTAQLSANRLGQERLQGLVSETGVSIYQTQLVDLNHYGEQLAKSALSEIPNGIYRFTDYMDDDGLGQQRIAISVTIAVTDGAVELDFAGTAAQVEGNINCPLPVTAAAVFYVFRCLMSDNTPACAGTFKPIQISAPIGSLINAERPHAVAAGNVETSSRLVDVVLGALAQAIPDKIPAASQGTMNNVAMGAHAKGQQPRWDYYETIGGGMGAHALAPGLSGVQSHMTNTLNTPVESVELHYPLRVLRYQLRPGSGGRGKHRGGEGLLREYEFLAPASVSLLTERRAIAPWGMAGGSSGGKGLNQLNGEDLPAKCAIDVKAGDRLTIATPGGGGWGESQNN